MNRILVKRAGARVARTVPHRRLTMKLPLPNAIPARLRQFDRGQKRLLALRGLADTVLACCISLVLVALVEWLIHPALAARVWLSAVNYAVLFGCFIWRVALPLARSAPLREVAWRFEQAAKRQFQERIVAAVELSESAEAPPPGISRWMIERTITLAAEEIGAADAGALLERKPAVLAWQRALVTTAALALVCVLPGAAPRLWLALNPYASTARLSRILLSVLPGDCRIPRGTSLEIRTTGPNLPDDVRAVIRWNDGFEEVVPMARTQTNEFTLALPSVSQGFGYRIQAGDAESVPYKVKVDMPPRLSAIRLMLEPPAYTRWTNRLVEGGSADFLAGTHVRLDLETADEKLAAAQWQADIPQTTELRVQDQKAWLDLQPTNELTYQLRLIGANQLRSDSQKWSLRPLADASPEAKLTVLGSDLNLVQANEILPLQCSASDDVGLKTVDLAVLKQDAELALKPIYAAAENAPAARKLKEAVNFNLAELSCATGDELQLQLITIDLAGQTNRTEPLTFTIGAPDKAAEAQLAVRIRQLVSELVAQADDLQQTRAAWVSIMRNFREQDARSQLPALAVLKSRLSQFGTEIQALGQRLEHESETHNAPEARFMYRLGTTISTWGGQQEEVLLANCGGLEAAASTNLLEIFTLGRELFSRALLDLEQYRKVVSVLAGVFETDVLAIRCEAAQGRYKRGLPVLRGENVIAPLGRGSSGLKAIFFEGISLNGKILEQKIDLPRFDNYAPASRREQWSARYEGDINLSRDGEWTVACIADDGVRLSVDGKAMLPAAAWTPHPATQYQGELKLSSGWHPLTIEFFQAGSESKLQLLAGLKGEALQEVPTHWLRPPAARESNLASTNLLLSSLAKEALTDRVRSSMLPPASVPPAIAPLTNDVQSETLSRSIREKFPSSALLASNLAHFASWTADDSRKAEGQADELTGLSKEAQRLLREELEKYRWRYEGAAALKEIQNALEELRELKQELRQQPWHDRKARTEPEQAKIDVAKAWQKELKRASASASHRFFETAKQKDATLGERVTALNATTKLEKEFQPVVEKLGTTLEQNLAKDEMAGQMEQRLNELTDRFRELNEMQEKINREEIAATARRALLPARNFERAQKAGSPELAQRYEQMRQGASRVARAERIAGEYSSAERLEQLAGSSPDNAKGKETAREIRDLAARTDRNVPSLAQTIPPPMRDQTQALEQQKDTAPEAANALAKPRLAMALESARLVQQADRKTAVAYGLLGEDLGTLLDAPEKLTAPALRPLADRAAALAGEKGEEARQAEISAANERAKQLAEASPDNPEALANRLEEMSVLAKQAAGDASKRQPLNSQLRETSKLAPPIPNWYDSTDAREIAASAAKQSADEIQGAPNQWESYNDASQELTEAARQIQMNQAASELGELNPYAAPQSAAESLAQGKPGSSDLNGDLQGQAGNAITQPTPKGIDQAEWARLSERLRQGIRSSGLENFTEEHQAAIRAYFERLSGDSQKGKLK